MIFNLADFIKNVEIEGQSGKYTYKLQYQKLKDTIKLWYETGHGRFEPNPIVLPQKIPLDEDDFTIFGLIQAESDKSIRQSTFGFTNSSPFFVKLVLDYFNEIWRIPRGEWKCEITYWRSSLNEKLINTLKDFWNNFLKIKRDRITIRQGTTYRLSENSSSGYGVNSLRLNNKIFQNIVIQLLNKTIKPMVEKQKDLARLYFRGLLSGDGSIVLRSNGSIALVSIGFNPRSNELDHYLKVLKCLNVGVNEAPARKEGRRAIQINGWKNYYKILQLTDCRPFLEDYQNHKFFTGFLNNQYVKSLIRLEQLSKLNDITYKDYVGLFGGGERNANDCLLTLVKLGFLKRVKVKRLYRHYLTESGKGFLQVVELMQKWVK